MTDAEFADYERRIAPARADFLERQYALEAAYSRRCAEHSARALRGVRTAGRYWALGGVLAAWSAQPEIDRETRALTAALDGLAAEYSALSARLESEVRSEA